MRIISFATLLVLVAFIAANLCGSCAYAENASSSSSSSTKSSTTGQAGALKSEDKITLKDGKVVTGKIIAEGSKAVVIIVTEDSKTYQRSIPRDKVQKIEKGQQSPDAEYYTTGVVDGKEKVVAKKEGSTVTTSGTATKPVAEKDRLNTSMSAEDIYNGLMKTSAFKDFASIIGKDKTTKIIEEAKSSTHLSKMLENYNTTSDVTVTDLRTLYNKTKVKLDGSTRTKLLLYMSKLAAKKK